MVFWPLWARAAWKKYQEPEPETLGKKIRSRSRVEKKSRAGAAKKLPGSSALIIKEGNMDPGADQKDVGPYLQHCDCVVVEQILKCCWCLFPKEADVGGLLWRRVLCDDSPPRGCAIRLKLKIKLMKIVADGKFLLNFNMLILNCGDIGLVN